MTDQVGFRIGSQVYPIPDGGFKFGEAGLICQVSGLGFNEFLEMLADPERSSDPRVWGAMLAVAYQRQKRCSDKQAAEFVRNLSIETVQFEGGDEEGEEGDATGPPAEPLVPGSGDGTSNASSLSGSPPSPELRSAEVIQLSSGDGGSATDSVSHQTA